MKQPGYNLVNGITLYRLLAAPVLIGLTLTHQLAWFKWLLPVSFLSDALDGYFARRWRVTSVRGSRLDSVADLLTLGATLLGLFIFRIDFVRQELCPVLVLLGLYLVQTVMALVRYGKISSFHTYLAKTAAVCQAGFFVYLFFSPVPPYLLFYVTAGLTAIELIEEIILVVVLSRWEANVKGLYWVLTRRDGPHTDSSPIDIVAPER